MNVRSAPASFVVDAIAFPPCAYETPISIVRASVKSVRFFQCTRAISFAGEFDENSGLSGPPLIACAVISLNHGSGNRYAAETPTSARPSSPSKTELTIGASISGKT